MGFIRKIHYIALKALYSVIEVLNAGAGIPLLLRLVVHLESLSNNYYVILDKCGLYNRNINKVFCFWFKKLSLFFIHLIQNVSLNLLRYYYNVYYESVFFQ